MTQGRLLQKAVTFQAASRTPVTAFLEGAKGVLAVFKTSRIPIPLASRSKTAIGISGITEKRGKGTAKKREGALLQAAFYAPTRRGIFKGAAAT